MASQPPKLGSLGGVRRPVSKARDLAIPNKLHALDPRPAVGTLSWRGTEMHSAICGQGKPVHKSCVHRSVGIALYDRVERE